MNRMAAFLVVTGLALVSLLLILFWSMVAYQGSISMTGMMGQMMGSGYGTG